MYLVAMAAGAAAAESAVADLVWATGLSRYEAAARLRVLATSPGILASFADPQEAEALVLRLKSLGFSAWTMAQPNPDRICVRSFHTHQDRLLVYDQHDATHELRLADVWLLVHGTRFATFERFLYAYSTTSSPLALSESTLRYDLEDDRLLPTRAANFAQAVQTLRVSCSRATFDARLLSRVEQGRLLGLSLRPEVHLELAIALLATTARTSSPYR